MSASLALVAGMTAALYTLAPTGWYQLCQEDPTQCQTVIGDMPSVREADAVNRAVNAAMQPQEETGGADVWKVGGPTGDCEDYALAKRDLLIRSGVGSAYVRIAIGETARGESHAVAVVTTKSGTYVLDNLDQRLVPIARSKLRITAVQSPADPRMWLRPAH